MLIAITTTRRQHPDAEEMARRKARELGLSYVRREKTLAEMAEKAHVEGFLIVGDAIPYFWSGGESYRFHVGAFTLRRYSLLQGRGDRLCALLPKKRPLSVLDCTFGQGGDSLTLSWYLGEAGTVTSLERSTVLYEIGKAGIAHFQPETEDAAAALRRIHLLHADYRDFLQQAPEKSFDVVYFDPMFQKPVKREQNDMEGFRAAASHEGLTEEPLRRAMQVAKLRVIVKERPFSPIFQWPEFTEVHRKRSQSTAYGVVEVAGNA